MQVGMLKEDDIELSTALVLGFGIIHPFPRLYRPLTKFILQ